MAAPALAAAVLVLASCAPTVPTTATQVSPTTGGGYITPVISGDGNTVVYRREADRNAGVETPRDLLVTRLDTRATTVIPSVRTVRALSANGRFVVHGYAPTWRLDTSDGTQTQLRAGSGASLENVAISADGATVAWLELHFTAGNCPCHRRLHVWRNGNEVQDHLLESGALSSIHDQYREFLAIDAGGSTVFVHRPFAREVDQFDVATGVLSAVPLQFPEITDLGPFGTLASYLAWSEWLQWGSSDGTTFRLESGDSAYLITAGPPVQIPSSGTDTSRFAMSPNGRWHARLVDTDVRPGVVHETYSVTDLSTGATRSVVSSDVGVPEGAEPSRTFNGQPSVSDDGKAVYGRSLAPLTGPWPPSIVYVDR